ncbi:hypothetical protein ABEB36_001256 [Hypothenemus hampei]|uniref:Uncharacterized protein n=1 Tax=Hypothenemus hampei TaxID=57062 RepID=A0ABD1FE01_HYPHA
MSRVSELGPFGSNLLIPQRVKVACKVGRQMERLHLGSLQKRRRRKRRSKSTKALKTKDEILYCFVTERPLRLPVGTSKTIESILKRRKRVGRANERNVDNKLYGDAPPGDKQKLSTVYYNNKKSRRRRRRRSRPSYGRTASRAFPIPCNLLLTALAYKQRLNGYKKVYLTYEKLLCLKPKRKGINSYFYHEACSQRCYSLIQIRIK